MTALGPTLNQVVYPGAGDVDDCWVVATIQAATAANPGLRKPTIPQFREFARKPDRPQQADGGSLTDVMNGAKGSWPGVVIRELRVPWAQFAHLAQMNGAGSVAINSGSLPASLRFGFDGLHQIAVAYDGRWTMSNPLAPNGSPPINTTEAVIKKAVDGYSPNSVFAAFFPEAPMQSFTILPETTVGSVVIKGPGHAYLRLVDNSLHPLPAAWVKTPAFGPVRLIIPIPGGAAGADRALGYIVGEEAAFVLAADVIFTPKSGDIAGFKAKAIAAINLL